MKFWVNCLILLCLLFCCGCGDTCPNKIPDVPTVPLRKIETWVCTERDPFVQFEIRAPRIDNVRLLKVSPIGETQWFQVLCTLKPISEEY